MASKVVSLRLKETEAAYLVHQARLMQRTQGETAALLLSEKLRQEEFPHIDFRSASGRRLAYVRGTRVAVWLLKMFARGYEMDVPRIAEHFDWPVERVQAALDYAEAYAEEIDPLVDETENMTYEKLRQKLPGLQLTRVSELGV